MTEVDEAKSKADRRNQVLCFLQAKIKAYENKAQQSLRQATKLDKLQVKIEKQRKQHEATLKRYEEDNAQRQQELQESDILLKTFRKNVEVKKHHMQEKYDALLDLERNIKQRTMEVEMKTCHLQDALLEWHAANQIISDNCQTAVFFGAEKFYHWHHNTPLLTTWLSHEERLHSTIYNTAQLLGIGEEIIAQLDFKKQLQEFAEMHYADVSQQPRLPPLKQINEQRQFRSDAFDQFHWKIMKQLRSYVRACDNLEQEVLLKERLRMKLNTLAMEVKQALQDDLHSGLLFCEDEASRKLDHILHALSRYSGLALSDQLLQDIRTRQQTELDDDIIELASSRLQRHPYPDAQPYTGNNMDSIFAEPSLVSSLSGSDETLTHQEKNSVSMEHFKDPSTILPSIKKPFHETRSRMRKSKALALAQSKLIALNEQCDTFHPKLRNTYYALRSEKVSDNLHNVELDETQEIAHALETIHAAKSLQLSSGQAVTDSIMLLTKLLDTVKKEEASIFDLKKDTQASRPPTTSNHAMGLSLERDQKLGHMDLSHKVQEDFAKTAEIVLKWLYQSVKKKYEEARTILNKELETICLLRPEMLKLPTPTNKTRANSKNKKFGNRNNLAGVEGSSMTSDSRDDTTISSTLPFRLHNTSTSKVDTPPSVVTNQEETVVESVHEMLTLSERLLHDLEEQLQTEHQRKQEVVAFTGAGMQNVVEASQQHQNEEGGALVKTNEADGDMLLGTAEVIMHGDLYHLSLIWKPRVMQATLVARNLLPKKKYKEYTMSLSLEILAEITGNNAEAVAGYMLSDTHKAFQHITHHIQMEEIKGAYYEELQEMFDSGLAAELEISMYLPHYLPFGSGDHHCSNSANESPAEQARGLLLKVMTLRAVNGELLLHCFAQIRSMR